MGIQKDTKLLLFQILICLHVHCQGKLSLRGLSYTSKEITHVYIVVLLNVISLCTGVDTEHDYYYTHKILIMATA